MTLPENHISRFLTKCIISATTCL